MLRICETETKGKNVIDLNKVDLFLWNRVDEYMQEIKKYQFNNKRLKCHKV